MDSQALDQLAGLLRRATALMEGAGQAGWLLRMAAEEHAHEEFVGLHNSILEILQASGRKAQVLFGLNLPYSHQSWHPHCACAMLCSECEERLFASTLTRCRDVDVRTRRKTQFRRGSVNVTDVVCAYLNVLRVCFERSGIAAARTVDNIGSRCVEQAQRVNTLASGRPLGYGEYKDCARPLRRLLKQFGSGSLEGGLRFAQTNGDALAELVALLNVDRPVLIAITITH